MKKNIIKFFVIYIILLSLPLITYNKLMGGISEIFTCDNHDNIDNKDQQKVIHNNKTIAVSKITNSNNNNKEKEQINELTDMINDAKQNISNPTNNESNILPSDGFFKILNLQTGQIDNVPEQDFVIGAVCAEMPPTFHPEALKAQAISSHTYALKMKQEQRKNPDPDLKGADFSADPTHWNKYVTKDIAKARFGAKFDEYWDLFSSAANNVMDIVMLYDNEPIIAAYHAISSGKTESAHIIWGGEAPYLAPTQSYGDDLAPDYKTSLSFSVKEVKNILINNYPNLTLDLDPGKWFNNITRSASGSVLNINFNNYDISGPKIRSMFNLRSANFIVEYNKTDETFTFIVKGYGHDIGLSQYGADYMAKNGADFKKILNHYYTDISFGKVAKIS